MLKRIAIVSALLSLPLAVACTEVNDAGPEDQGAGGKADELGCDGELDELCDLEFGGGWVCESIQGDQVECCIGSDCLFTDLPEDRRNDEDEEDEEDELGCPSQTFVTHAAHDDNDHVISNCHDAASGQFTEKVCCEDQIDEITAISGCPAQVRFNDAPGGQKRCVDDASGQFVPTSCCAPLCSITAEFDDGGACRDTESGQFDEKICCHRNDALEGADCGGAAWEQLTAGPREGDFACRNDGGRFALDVCCADLCAEAISRNPTAIPPGCQEQFLAEVGSECPADSAPNSAGICHNPDNGQFVKAACCDHRGRTEGLDRGRTDECLDGRRSDCE